MLLHPLLRPRCNGVLDACNAALVIISTNYPDANQRLALMSTEHAMSFRTQAMPSILTMGPAAFASASSCEASFSGSQSYKFTLDQRRMSSFGCSTSDASCNSSSSYAGQQSRRLRFSRRRLPFASITNSDSGSIGQLRWLSSRSSDSSAAGNDSQQQQHPSPTPGIHPNMTEAEIKAAATAATTTDTFKAGDSLASGRYQLLRKLGEGELGLVEGMGEGRFTTAWVGQDCHTNQQVVLKLVEAGDSISYVAGTREAALHAMAGRHPNILTLLDAFEHRSEAGRHACMVLEQAGSNLDVVLEVWRQDHRQQYRAGGDFLFATPQGVAAVRVIARQLLTGLNHLHSRGIVHMDLSTDNILVDKLFLTHVQVLAKQQGFSWWRTAGHALNVLLFKSEKSLAALNQAAQETMQQEQFHTRGTLRHAVVKLTDFGRAAPYKFLQQEHRQALAPLQVQHHAVDWTKDGPVVMGDPGLRAPEEILAMDYVAPAYDIWRAGCILYELAMGRPMFDVNHWSRMRERHHGARLYSDDAIHLMQMQGQLGMWPREFIRRSPVFNEFFFKHTDSLRLTNVYDLVPGGGSTAKMLALQTVGLEEEAVRQFTDFIHAMLIYDPLKRPTAEQLLQHKFLQQDDDGDMLRLLYSLQHVGPQHGAKPADRKGA